MQILLILIIILLILIIIVQKKHIVRIEHVHTHNVVAPPPLTLPTPLPLPPLTLTLPPPLPPLPPQQLTPLAILDIVFAELLARELAVQMRQNIARETNVGTGAAANAYLDMAITHTNDTQNSHDTTVISCLKSILKRIRHDQLGMELPTTDEIINHIRSTDYSDNRPELTELAIETIKHIEQGHLIMALESTDKECLQRIWLRASDPKNAEVKEKIYQAIFDALIDSWEYDDNNEKKMVCVNGRSSRILSSLVLLDWDKSNWDIKRLEQIKNDIFEQVRQLIDEIAHGAISSDDIEMNKVGRLYFANSLDEINEIGEINEAANEKLNMQMRNAIIELIDNYMYGEDISQDIIIELKKEALAAIET